MIQSMFTVRVLKIDPDTVYMGEPYGAWVMVEMQDGTRLELFYDHRDGPLSLLWKRVAIEISGGISETVEKIPEPVQRSLSGNFSSFEAWGVIVKTWSTRYGTREWRHGLVDFGIGTISINLLKKDPEDLREGDYVHVQTTPTDLDNIHELVEYKLETDLPDAAPRELPENGRTAPFIIEFFIDEENLSLKNYQLYPSTGRSRCEFSPRDAEDAPWTAWIKQRGLFSLKIGENPVFREETSVHGPHFIETSLFSLLGVFTQSCLELLGGRTVVIRPGSSSGPHLVLKPRGRDLTKISVLKSDAAVISDSIVLTEEYMEAIIGAVDLYLRQVLEIHPHVSRIPYPRLLADRRNEVMLHCRHQGFQPGNGQTLDYDALVDRAWRAYRPLLPSNPEGKVSHISFDVALIEGKTPETLSFRFSLLIDGQMLFDGIEYDKPPEATLFVWHCLSSVGYCIEGNPYKIDLTAPGPRTITLTPDKEGTIRFVLDNMYLPGIDARDILLRLEDWMEATIAMADMFITLVRTSPLQDKDIYIAYPFSLVEELQEIQEKYRIYLEGRGGE